MLHQVFISTFDNPFINLALEASLLHLWQPKRPWLFLWRNRPCIVIGRFQNPWLECRMDILSRNHIPLVRRTSGGGCVYHDHGNLCFSFFNHNWDQAKEKNLDFIITSLAELGIELERNQRHDLVHLSSDGSTKKVSGSAFKQKKDRCLHHGTLLVESDLNALKSYLSISTANITSRALPSTPSPVANLSDFKEGLTLTKVQNQLADSFSPNIAHLDQGFIKKHNSLYQKEYRKISDAKWRYGETPAFTQTLTKGSVQLKLEVCKGVIEKVSSLSRGDTCSWEQTLVGQDYAKAIFV